MLKRSEGVCARPSTSALVALLCACGLGTAAAQEPSEAVTVDVEHCIGLESPEARLACFGASVDAELEKRDADESARSSEPKAETRSTSRASDRAETPLPARTEERAATGASARQSTRVETVATARALEQDDAAARRDAERPTAEPEDEHSGTIVALEERLPNAYVITLDNGEIWQQTEPKRYPLRPGLEVRIYPTHWGESYRLNGRGTGGHIQVRQVQ